MSARIVAAAALFSLAPLSGCQQPNPAEPQPKPPGDWRREVLGKSVRSKPIDAVVIGNGPVTVLILATIHGNEAAGTPLLRRLEEQLARQPEIVAGRRVVLIPVANPDGHAMGIRHNSRGVDLNRNFPAGNWKNDQRHGKNALSEPESLALHRALKKYRPDRIVSIHQPLDCLDYDGPGQALASAMAAVCDLPLKRLGGRPGSLGSYAGETLKIPIITVEFPGRATGMREEELWSRYGNMLLAAIRFPEPVEAK